MLSATDSTVQADFPGYTGRYCNHIPVGTIIISSVPAVANMEME